MAQDKEKIIIEVEDLEVAAEKKNMVRVLVFALGAEYYCIEIKQAKEVLALPEITRIPNRVPFITGVINLRGEIIALIDLRYFFSLEQRERNEQSRVIVTDISGSLTGILVDKVEDTIDIDEKLIQAPLATLPEKVLAYTKGHVQLENRILILLDLEKVLHSEEVEALRKTGG
ncbi:MAG: chemotaxis protein CheW [Candidatus Omnitrophota bacterium]